MFKAVSREIGRGQEDPAERFYWVDVYLIGIAVLGQLASEFLVRKHTRVMIMMYRRDWLDEWEKVDDREYLPSGQVVMIY